MPDGIVNEFGPNYLAYFSSRGPTADNRIKPDVTRLGGGLSVLARFWSRGHRRVAVYHFHAPGHFMATPTVAGYAAMLRQYCRQGWHSTGVKTDANGFMPSGALLRHVDTLCQKQDAQRWTPRLAKALPGRVFRIP